MAAERGRSDTLRVAVVYRVLQTYRMALFERLGEQHDLELKVFHGPSFPGTKVVNGENNGRVNAEILRSLPLKLRTRNGLAVAPFSPGLYRALSRYAPDVIICEGPSNLPNNLLVYLYRMVHGAAVLQWGLGAIKGRRPSRARRLAQPLIAFLERRADVCIAYSERGAEYYRGVGVAPGRIVVATNVIDTEERLEQVSRLPVDEIKAEAHEDSDFVVLFVGGLTKGKKVEVLIDAFARIAGERDARGRAPRLWIVGDGPRRESLEGRAAPLGDQVRFFGRVARGVSRLFVAADVFVLPGLGGLAVSDALVHGVPVVASIGDGAEADLVTPETGILDEHLDVDRLAGHLARLRSQPELRSRLAAGAIEKIRSGANIHNYVRRVREAIDLAHASRRGG